MATQQLDFAGYFFGVEDRDGHVTEYPNYKMAMIGCGYRRLQGHSVRPVMWGIYRTELMEAKEPDVSPDE